MTYKYTLYMDSEILSESNSKTQILKNFKFFIKRFPESYLFVMNNKAEHIYDQILVEYSKKLQLGTVQTGEF